MKFIARYNKLMALFIVAIVFVGTQVYAEVTNIPYGRPNIALGGTVISSSPAVRGDPAYINDGLLSTLLYSYINNAEGRYYCEFVLDLKQSYTIDKIDLYVAQTRGFSLYISDDNQNWTEFHTREWDGSVSTPVAIPLSPSVSGRYLKYYGWASWSQYVGIVDISVYEEGSVPAKSPLGSIGTVNIAKDKPVTLISGGEELDHPVENIVDGNTETSWIVQDKWTDDETGKNTYGGGIVIDLEEKTSIGKIIVNTKKYHSITISFPEEISDFWGKEWSFSSTPNLFASEETGSGEIVFDLKGLIMSRYITISIQTIQVGSEQPEISEVEVYKYDNMANPAVLMYLLD
jgi:hypothetical protein